MSHQSRRAATALNVLAAALGAALKARGARVTTAESCTGGGIAEAITRVPGSSAWFDQGWVTYSNAAKQRLLNVSAEVLTQHGAVSEAVVRAMAEGARAAAQADWAVAVSGIAGPDGGTPDKPVGTVWLAWAGPAGTEAERHVFPGDRAAVRAATVRTALDALFLQVSGSGSPDPVP